MGMDIYGKAPASTEGEYFRNSVWWWHPLAEYITHAHPDLAAACTLWHTNDGDGLDADDAAALADALTEDLNNGAVALRGGTQRPDRSPATRDVPTVCRDRNPLRRHRRPDGLHRARMVQRLRRPRRPRTVGGVLCLRCRERRRVREVRPRLGRLRDLLIPLLDVGVNRYTVTVRDTNKELRWPPLRRTR